MNKNKQLIATVKTYIYQHEKLVDKIQFSSEEPTNQQNNDIWIQIL